MRRSGISALTTSPRTAIRGVSLIELMVSLAIGLLLIVGAVTVYVQSRNMYRVSETAARLQEVARYALDVIEPDVRLAGYWGLTNRSDFVENRGAAADAQQAVATGITGNCGNNWIVDVDRFLDGRDATATGGTGYDLGCPGTDPANWADVLILRRASVDERPLTAGRVQVQTNRMRGVVFKDGTLPAGFGAAAASETRDLIVRAYYIRNNAPSSNGLPQFQLRRKTLAGTSILDEEVVPGVADLQVQFGIDATGDGNADRYVDPGSVPAGARIASARIWLLIVAEEGEVGFANDTDFQYANADHGVFGDNRRRVLVFKTIQIRNSRA